MNKNENSDRDPLDAYMDTINETIKKEKKDVLNKPLKSIKNYRGDIESFDSHEDFFQMVSDDPSIGFDLKNDEYIDFEQDKNGNLVRVKKKIDPLQSIDHSKIRYASFNKNTYSIHPKISSLSADEIQHKRSEINISITGNNITPPVMDFRLLNFDENVLQRLFKLGISTPTPVQGQSIPIILQGKNMIGIAETGSGKTAAFVLPIILKISAKSNFVTKINENEDDSGKPLVLILAPTRELCFQIKSNVQKLCSKSIRCLSLCGGESMWHQQQSCANHVDVVIGTPGRIIDLVKKNVLFLHRIQYLVIDEVDKMLNMGFEEQVRSIGKNIRPDRQTVMFSATSTTRLKLLIQSIINENYVKVTQGDSSLANRNILQEFAFCKDSDEKFNLLSSLLTKLIYSDGLTLVFVNQKDTCSYLSIKLHKLGFENQSIHGDLSQHSRSEIISDYRNQKFKILIATDIASRGLDIAHIQSVINFDSPKKFQAYIHRIGRTGRAKNKGKSMTFVSPTDDPQVIYRIIDQVEVHDDIPNQILQLIKQAKSPHNNFSSKKSISFSSKSSNTNKKTLENLKRSSKFAEGSKRAKLMKESLKKGFKSTFVPANEDIQINSDKGLQKKQISRWD